MDDVADYVQSLRSHNLSYKNVFRFLVIFFKTYRRVEPRCSGYTKRLSYLSVQCITAPALKEIKFPHCTLVKIENIVESRHEREMACSATDSQDLVFRIVLGGHNLIHHATVRRFAWSSLACTCALVPFILQTSPKIIK